MVRNAKIFLMIAVVIGFMFYHGYYYNNQHQKQGSGKVDFAVFYVAGSTITNNIDLEPIDLYTQNKIRPAIESVRSQNGGTHYLYLPQAAVLFAPFGFTSLGLMAKIWAAVNSLIFITTFYAIIRWLLNEQKLYNVRYSLTLLGLLFAKTTESLTSTGQVNGLLLGLMMLTFIGLAHQNKRTGMWLSGIGVALSSVLKVFPGIFIPYFLLKKRWKAFAISAGTVIILTLATVPFFGIDGMKVFMTERLPQLASGEVTGVAKSSSLYGTTRSAIKNQVLTFGETPKKEITNAVDKAYPFVVLFFAIGIGYILVRHRNEEHPTHYLIDYGLIMLFILLCAKIVHLQYHLWTIPLLLLLIRLPFKKTTTWLYIAAIIILALTQYGKLLSLPGIDTWLIKPNTLGELLLLAILIGLRTPWLKDRYAELFTTSLNGKN